MIKNIFSGIKAYGDSLKLINTLGLWKYFGIPMIISLLTAIAVGFSAWGFSDDIGKLISNICVWEYGLHSGEAFILYKQSIQFVNKYRGVAIGNGIFFMLMLLIPVIGIIFVLPLSVTAAITEKNLCYEKTNCFYTINGLISFVFISPNIHTKRSFYRKMGEF